MAPLPLPADGVYTPKNNNSLVLNYRNGRFNTFLTYSMNLSKYLMYIYAYRKYYDKTGRSYPYSISTPISPGGFSTIRSSWDGLLCNPKTTIGLVLGGSIIHRNSDAIATDGWIPVSMDSAISTNSTSNNHFRNE